MKTTVTEFATRPCAKCGGAGFLSAYQHRKGGVCFRCGGTGKDEQLIAVERDMSDEEVVAALAAAGFPVVDVTPAPVIVEGDFLSIFLTDEQAAAKAEAMVAARAFLAAL